MPRTRGPIYPEHFTIVKRKKWTCNVCTGRKRRIMNGRQAKFHGGSAKHCSKAETATFFKHPGNFIAVTISRWQCNICTYRRGRRGRPMTPRLAKLHEALLQHYSKVAATLFKHPKIFKYARDGKWVCEICKTNAMTVKKARAHEIRCQKVGANENEEARSMHRSEGDDSTTSTYQEHDEEEDEGEDDEDDDDEDNDEDDDNDDNDNDNDGNEDDNDDTAFVENFLRNQDVDASHRKRMRRFYKMPTDQKIQKIREVIDVIRDHLGQSS